MRPHDLARATGAQRDRRDRHQLRGGPGIAAREQRHLVSAADELLGEPGEHPLRAAVALRGHGLVQWCEQRDLHRVATNAHSTRSMPGTPSSHATAYRMVLPLLSRHAAA